MATPTAYERLTPRQRLFVDKYLSCLNGAQAAREAGYSAQAARSIASENLTKTNIKLAIEERMKEAQGGKTLTPERLRQKTAELVNDDTLRPDTKLKALELAGKMTPGTFEPAPTAGSTINFFTILAKLAGPASTNSIEARPAPAPAADIIDVPIPAPTTTPTTTGVPAQPDDVPDEQTGQANPQGGGVDDNTPPPKFVDQNPSLPQVLQSSEEGLEGGSEGELGGTGGLG